MILRVAAEELKPKFIALAGSPISIYEWNGFPGNRQDAGTRSRNSGIFRFRQTECMIMYMVLVRALAEIAKRIKGKKEVTSKSVNLLGVTPLRFRATGACGCFDTEMWKRRDGRCCRPGRWEIHWKISVVHRRQR